MKANELMIGDWVFVHKPTCKGHRVDYINEMDEEIGADGEIYNVCDIWPIPLTSEILEKNGFEKQGYPGWLIYTKEYMIQWRNDYPNVLSIDSFSSNYGSFKRFNVDYVHKLQNALRLCGIEKEIEL